MVHKLYLSMYTFSIKERNKKNAERIDNNEFLERAYSNIQENKFTNGFAKDIIALMDQKVFKDSSNTHGALLDKHNFIQEQRVLDILIDGGITGIKQFLINEDGVKSEVSKDDIIGPKFFARFWLPAGTKTGFIFIQKYGVLGIKPLFDSIIKELLKKHDFSIHGLNRLKPTTTKKRLNDFLKNAVLKDLTIVSSMGLGSSGAPEASSVQVRLRKFQPIKGNDKQIDREAIQSALMDHGISIDDRNYDIKGVYEYKNGNNKQERTINLDNTEDTINIIPNIMIPETHIDSNNYPIFDKMIDFVNKEMIQIKKEAKQ